MNTETDVHAESRELLRAIQHTFQEAVKNNTMEDMRPYIDKDFSFVSFTDKSFENFDAFLKQWDITRKKMVGNGSFTTEMNPETTLFEDNLAVCKGNAVNKMVDKKGKSFEFSSNWTVVCKHVQGEWKILRAHNSLDPFENPMLVSGVKSHLVKAGIVGLLLGLILMFLASMFF